MNLSKCFINSIIFLSAVFMSHSTLAMDCIAHENTGFLGGSMPANSGQNVEVRFSSGNTVRSVSLNSDEEEFSSGTRRCRAVFQTIPVEEGVRARRITTVRRVNSNITISPEGQDLLMLCRCRTR